MAKVLSSISGNLISAASAGYAPTNSADVSAIASAYQVVSATGTQLYAGTAHVTSVNSAPLSASRAGNAANASMANSAYYDGTGRLISSLPDSATVSSIASSYAESAASGKLDTSAQVVTATAGDGTYVTSINGMGISGQGSGGGGAAFPVEYTSGSCSASLETGYFVSTSRPSLTLSSNEASIYPRVIVRNGTGAASKGSYYLSDAFEFTTGAAGGSGAKVLRVDPQQVSSKNFLLYGPSGSTTYGTLALRGSNSSAYVCIGSTNDEHTNFVRPSSISSWWDVHDTVSANSASWGGGATSDYVETSATLVTIGSNVSANGTSFVQGDQNTATYFSLVQGLDNSGNNNNTLLQGYKNRGSSTNVFAQGTNNSAFGCSFAQGNVNKAAQTSVAQGDHCSASSNSFSQGYNNSASLQSFAQGYANSAYNRSFAQGLGVVVKNTAAAFGTYNLSSDGDTSTGNSAAFAIGDGTDANARHNLMLVTKDGEITMYSSTADTTGTGIMSAIRAISAAATGGVDSATVSAIASGYASGKADSSALSSYALSADVSSTVDVVSTQSANWGGSALALSAGPGVTLTKSGNTLIAGLDETVLWSGDPEKNTTTAKTYSLSEDLRNFTRYRVVVNPHEQSAGAMQRPCQEFTFNLEYNTTSSPIYAQFPAYTIGGNILTINYWYLTGAEGTCTSLGLLAGVRQTDATVTTGITAYSGSIVKIVGLNRTAGV